MKNLVVIAILSTVASGLFGMFVTTCMTEQHNADAYLPLHESQL